MIRVTKESVSVYGGCNGCSERTTRKVYVVEVALNNNGLVFRLCLKCKRELIAELKKLR